MTISNSAIFNDADLDQLSALAIFSLPDPVFVKDRAHRLLIVNQAYCEMIGQPLERLIGRTEFEFLQHDAARIAWGKDDEVLQTGVINVNLERMWTMRGERIVEVKRALMLIGQTVYLVGVMRDLSVMTQIQHELSQNTQALERRLSEQGEELKRANAQIQNLAFFDALTGLPNRRLLISSLERRIQSGAVAAFYIDLDNFKWVNDSHGHQFGDQMLVQFGERLRSLSYFSMVARVGGDEFVALSHEREKLDQMTLAKIARELLECMSQPVYIDLHEASASVSVGVAVSPVDGEDTVEILQNADAAMYRAKERGRNQYAFFTKQQENRARENVTLERGLRRALRAGEIAVMYQPIFDARTRKQSGVEALARWRDDQLGQVAPDRFVQVAEITGLIHELSHNVLRQAINAAHHHLPAGQRLCVNLSALQLDRMTLVEDVRRTLADSGFNPKRLELEITESVAASKGEQLSNVLLSLRQLGIGFALDDFGTGFSSLAQIQRLPIDRIKIDKSFINDIATSSRSRALLIAMIRMAHAMELSVLAEGVETAAQYEALVELGIDEVQGYLFGRPGPLELI
jgi:diguanylate cyclase (GGDEF)-like protein/PAS domain S-box-containing protein